LRGLLVRAIRAWWKRLHGGQASRNAVVRWPARRRCLRRTRCNLFNYFWWKMDTWMFASEHLIAYLQNLFQEVNLAANLCRQQSRAVEVRQCGCDCRHCAGGSRQSASRQSTARAQNQRLADENNLELQTRRDKLIAGQATVWWCGDGCTVGVGEQTPARSTKPRRA
jgi:hypothetical protein